MQNERRTPSMLRMRRITLGLRIRDVANKTGLSDSRISQIERDDGKPTNAFELACIEDYLGEKEMRAGIIPGTVDLGRKEIGLS